MVLLRVANPVAVIMSCWAYLIPEVFRTCWGEGDWNGERRVESWWYITGSLR